MTDSFHIVNYYWLQPDILTSPIEMLILQATFCFLSTVFEVLEVLEVLTESLSITLSFPNLFRDMEQYYSAMRNNSI